MGQSISRAGDLDSRSLVRRLRQSAINHHKTSQSLAVTVRTCVQGAPNIRFRNKWQRQVASGRLSQSASASLGISQRLWQSISASLSDLGSRSRQYHHDAATAVTSRHPNKQCECNGANTGNPAMCHDANIHQAQSSRYHHRFSRTALASRRLSKQYERNGANTGNTATCHDASIHRAQCAHQTEASRWGGSAPTIQIVDRAATVHKAGDRPLRRVSDNKQQHEATSRALCGAST